MNKLAIIGSAAALLIAGSAQAQTFTITANWTGVEPTGGMGPERMAGRGGNNSGNFEVVLADGTELTGAVRCVGMTQHPSNIFRVVISCESTDSEGGEVSWLLGCNPIGEGDENRGMGCVGAIQGNGGGLEGRSGAMTMHINGEGQSTGTGQWYE